MLGPWETTEALEVEKRKPRPPLWKGYSARCLEKKCRSNRKEETMLVPLSKYTVPEINLPHFHLYIITSFPKVIIQ